MENETAQEHNRVLARIAHEDAQRLDQQQTYDLIRRPGIGLITLMAPRHFYRWPLWQKLLLVIPVFILGLGVVALRAWLNI